MVYEGTKMQKMIEAIRGKWTDKDAIMLEISDRVYDIIDLDELDHKQSLLTLIDMLMMINDISEVMLNTSIMNESVITLMHREYRDIEDAEFE